MRRLCKLERCNGFTILELLIVLSLLVTLAVMAIPRFNSIARVSRFLSASDQLLNDLNFARRTAISLNTRVQISFANNANGPSYTITDIINNRLLRSTAFEAGSYGAGLAINTATGAVLRYDPRGLPTDQSNSIPASANVTLSGPNGQSRVLTSRWLPV